MTVVTRRISAWAGPVIGIAAVLCAAIVVAYASGTRVVISIPAAADIGGPTPTGTSDATPVPLNTSALTLVHPTHPVEVLDGPESSTESEGPASQADDATASASPRTATATERDEVAAPDAAPSKPTVPAAASTPSAHPTQATDTWADDDPTRSPKPTSSGWRPTGSPSPSPSWSHSHHDDSADDGTGGASQPTP
jgi:hypothetical protein